MPLATVSRVAALSAPSSAPGWSAAAVKDANAVDKESSDERAVPVKGPP